ncbi:MAG: UDP-N-acetylmuramoyl-tripeptide--D-alanyl-D-alanine ligase [Solirubrobacteraceae bacterium]
MRQWDAQQVARAAGARLLETTDGPGPDRVMIDSRMVTPNDLFVGLRGEHLDGGAHAPAALAAGAWGVLVSDAHATALGDVQGAAVLAHPDPLKGLQELARAWREELGAQVIAITGSVGKTSTKDILAALIGSHRRTVCSPENFNTEIGMPLAILAAPEDTEVLVLELAMRGPGQIAQLTEIASPDVGVITNIGPVHLELLGSLEAIAAAKAELIAGMAPTATIVIPAAEPLLEPHRRPEQRVITFGGEGDVRLIERTEDGRVRIAHGQEIITLRPSFSQSHNLENLLAAVAAAQALDITPTGELQVAFSTWRGERLELGREIVLINDCYNANPISMRAALQELQRSAPARRVAVLGDMLELGPEADAFHRQLGEYAHRCGVQLLVTVGPLAARMREQFGGEAHSVPDADAATALLESLLAPRDTVLVKGSRGVGLERIAAALDTQRKGS